MPLPRGESQKIISNILFGLFFLFFDGMREKGSREALVDVMFVREKVSKLNPKGHAEPSALHEDVCRLYRSAVCKAWDFL